MNSSDQLWRAIYELYSLLMDQVNDEAAYQAFFERHPIAFSAIGIDDAKSFENRSPNSLPFDSERGYSPAPDFIGVNHSTGRVAIIELKTPFVEGITTSRSDGNRAKFKAAVESYISQATEYVDSIRENADARNIIECLFGIQRISDYRIFLITGISENNDTRLVCTLTSQRKIPTEIIFYDALLERMASQYSITRKDGTSRAGFCCVLHLIFESEQIYTKAFLGEYGGAFSDRVSIIIENRDLIFECLDFENNIHRLRSAITSRGPHYVRFEFSNDENGIYMSLNVNNVEQDLRVGKSALRLNPDTTVFTLGADSRGEFGACFIMLIHYSLNRTMDLCDRLGSFHYFERKIKGTLCGLEFKPESFMVRLPTGDLVQSREDLKPVYRVLPA